MLSLEYISTVKSVEQEDDIQAISFVLNVVTAQIVLHQ